MLKVSGLLIPLAFLLLAACQASSTTRAGEDGVPGAKGGGEGLGAALTGQVRCADGCAPHVELFDAVALTPVVVGPEGEYRLPSWQGGRRYLALSATGYLPRLLPLEAGDAPPTVDLESANEPGHGYLFGVTVHTVVGGKRHSVSTLRPVGGKSLTIGREQERQEFRSDENGEFRLVLPAGHYVFIVDGRRQMFEIPPQGSLFLPVVVGTMMVD